ncbi:MAG: hypothetical protein O2913_14300 [Chloroflexi bacterium]|nr:hypothetical protein [Chloroflexota bacterium]
MPKHRSLTLRTFVHSIPWELFQRYFQRLTTDQQPSPWAFLNEDAMQEFLEDPQNAEAAGAILEDFKRINDIARGNTSLLVSAYRQADVIFDPEASAQELSMRLFLDHREAFRGAWSRYLFFSADAKLTSHRLDVATLTITDQQVTNFRNDLNQWFGQLAKGGQCNVLRFEESGHTILHVERGSYLRTVARWREDRIEIDTFRPATEDLLVYNPDQSSLTIKAGLIKDRNYYLQAFAGHIAEDMELAQRTKATEVFSLEPLRSGTFDYSGNEAINSITLVRAKLRLDDVQSPQVEIKSRDVLETLQRNLHGLSLDQGTLSSVRLRFQIQPENERPATVSFDIEPPARTNLAQKRYADIIEEYLKEQGVKLR